MKLNFGCGRNILKGYENVDIQEGKGINNSFDFNVFPYPYPGNYFDYIYCDNVLEHLDNPEWVMLELWRITKPNGIIRIIVPYYNSKNAYNDITHKHYFNERAIKVMCGIDHAYDTAPVKRFNIKSIELIPIPLFKLVPKFIREKLSGYIGNIIMAIDCEINVIK